ncbi:hypothetical protein M426DRAFT_74951 [Hypoxylon sp. CI-4A]|nr:hypothetical protein M426DRAFT_74951 [Hypoxylon sp. CI-4A]
MASPQSKGTVLVTGASGFVGGQIVREALAAGFQVRITARNETSAAKTLSRFRDQASLITWAVVEDITSVSAYEPAFADGAVTHIIHAASPFNLAPRDNVRDLLDPAIKGATAILEAAVRYGGGKVRGVVVTSSFAAVKDLSFGRRVGHAYSGADWNPVTYAEGESGNGVVAYCASKALGERAVWDFAKAHPDAGFAVTAICPPWVLGPYAWDLEDTRGLSTSVQQLHNLIDAETVPAFDFGGYADSREVAAAHVLALQTPEADGKRFLVGQDFRYQAVVDYAREAFPELRDRLPVGNPGEWEEGYRIDGSLATKVLGLKYKTLKETVVDTYRQLLKARELEGRADP